MNKRELQSHMKRHGDTGESLAKHLGIDKSTLSLKINGHNDFTLGEMQMIKERYSLSGEDINVIFFSTQVS